MARPCPDLRAATAAFLRFLVTPAVSKYRAFRWIDSTIIPDQQLIAVASAEDYLFGVCQSRVHELWTRRVGNQLREAESAARYNVTVCFGAFPFPEPTEPQEQAIAAAARKLDELRERWLNPPEWTREEILEYPGGVEGPWSRYVHDPDDQGIGTVRYPRLVPKDKEAADKLTKRTLTNLYNQRPIWLDNAHRRLDEAVLAAYGWDDDPTDEHILERLLALNLAQVEQGGDP